MSWVRSIAAFLYEFVVGDDWTIAVGVVGVLALTAAVANLGSAWFVTPAGAIAVLGVSVWRAGRAPSR